MPTKKSPKSSKSPKKSVPVKTKEQPSKKGFFSSFTRFFYNPAAYQSVAKQSFSRAFDQLLILLTLVSFVLVLVAGVGIWKIRETVERELPNFEESLPDDVSVSIHDGILESNLPQPYFLPEQAFTNHDSVEGMTPKYLVVVDTQTPFSLEQIESFDSVMWLAKDRIYLLQDEGTLNYFNYPENLDRSFDKEDLTNWPQMAWTLMKFPLLFLGFFFFLGMIFFMVVGTMVHLAFVSFIWFFLSRLFGSKKEFATCYKLSIAALRPTLFVFGLLALFFVLTPLEMPSFVLSGLLLIFLLSNGCFSKDFPKDSSL